MLNKNADAPLCYRPEATPASNSNTDGETKSSSGCIKINDSLLTMAKNMGDVITKLNEAKDKYESALGDFQSHYLGQGLEKSDTYKKYVKSKIEGYITICSECKLLTELIYKDFEDLDKNTYS